MCPSGLGIRLQSEAHRFDSGHGLHVRAAATAAAATPAATSAKGTAVAYSALPAFHSSHGTFQSPYPFPGATVSLEPVTRMTSPGTTSS